MSVRSERAVVLLSGGLDSATTLAIARSQGFACRALSFRYGQRHARELRAARGIARRLEVPITTIRIDLRAFGGSALTGDIDVPKNRSLDGGDIPVTYVPARNTIFLSFALAAAETMQASRIFIGANAVDYSGYPDCRPEYLRAFSRMANLATRAGVEGRTRLRIEAPLLRMTKAEIVVRATELGVPLELTWSCYDPTPEGLACGGCDSCRLRRKGFREAGVEDPVRQAPQRRARRRRT